VAQFIAIGDLDIAICHVIAVRIPQLGDTTLDRRQQLAARVTGVIDTVRRAVTARRPELPGTVPVSATLWCNDLKHAPQYSGRLSQLRPKAEII